MMKSLESMWVGPQPGPPDVRPALKKFQLRKLEARRVSLRKRLDLLRHWMHVSGARGSNDLVPVPGGLDSPQEQATPDAATGVTRSHLTRIWWWVLTTNNTCLRKAMIERLGHNDLFRREDVLREIRSTHQRLRILTRVSCKLERKVQHLETGTDPGGQPALYFEDDEPMTQEVGLMRIA